MKELKLLIVEDDEGVIAGYESSIKAFNKTNEQDIIILPTFESEKEKALELLRDFSTEFDGAVVDLDLEQSGGKDASGNDIVREIKNNLRFPVFVISGTAHNLDDDLKSESAFFKVKNRDEDFDFIEEMTSIYNTGITEILNRKGTIEKYINNIFWKHLSNSMDVWITDKVRSPEQKQKSLLRYTLLHIQEYLELTSESVFENYHPAEIYITPPIKDKVFTGDIVRDVDSNARYIVLTPSCDLSHDGKTNNILIVKIESEGELLKFSTIIKAPGESNGNKKVAEKELKKLISNSKSNKFHFLPAHKSFPAGLIDFQSLTSVSKAQITETFQIEASINNNFTKDIISRFSYYYSRQGSPDFNLDEVYSQLIK